MCCKLLLSTQSNIIHNFFLANYSFVEKRHLYFSFAVIPNLIFRNNMVDAYTYKMSVSMATFNTSGINSGHRKVYDWLQ